MLIAKVVIKISTNTVYSLWFLLKLIQMLYLQSKLCDAAASSEKKISWNESRETKLLQKIMLLWTMAEQLIKILIGQCNLAKCIIQLAVVLQR